MLHKLSLKETNNQCQEFRIGYINHQNFGSFYCLHKLQSAL